MSNFTVIGCGSAVIFQVKDAGLSRGQKISATLLIIVNTITCLVAVTGNGLVISTLIKSKALKGPTYIITGTLSVLDFLVGAILQPMWIAAVGLPVLNTKNVCGFFYWGFALLVPVLSSIGALTVLTLIAIDRLIAVVFHLQYADLVTNRRAAFSVGIVLVFNFIISVTTYLDGKGTVYFMVISIITWVSYSIMLICYCTILVTVWVRGKEFVSNTSMAVTKTIGLASVVCGLCWLPFNVAFPHVLATTNPVDPKSLLRKMYVYEWLGTLLLGNSSLNFAIYYWRNKALRLEIQVQAKKIWNCVRIPSKVSPTDRSLNEQRNKRALYEDTANPTINAAGDV